MFWSQVCPHPCWVPRWWGREVHYLIPSHLLVDFNCVSNLLGALNKGGETSWNTQQLFPCESGRQAMPLFLKEALQPLSNKRLIQPVLIQWCLDWWWARKFNLVQAPLWHMKKFFLHILFPKTKNVSLLLVSSVQHLKLCSVSSTLSLIINYSAVD